MIPKQIVVFSMSLCALCFPSCSENQNSDLVETETIDFSSLEIRSMKELPQDTSYLLLHASNPDHIVGSVSKIVKYDNRFYFLDGRCRYAVAYDSLGNSIGRVGDVGKGHLEYLRCHDIAVDNTGNVYLSDGTSDKYVKYDRDLKAIEEHAADPEGTEIFITEDGHMLAGLSPWNVGEHEGHSVGLYDQQMNLTTTYGNIGTHDVNVAFGGTGFANSGQYVSYVPTCEIRDDVMLFSPKDGKIVKKLIFDFGDNSVPDKLKGDVEGNMALIKKYTRLQDIFNVTDDRVVGKISIDGQVKPFVIDRKNQTVYLGDEVESSDECITFIDNSFVSIAQIPQENYPDSVRRHIESNQTALLFNKFF